MVKASFELTTVWVALVTALLVTHARSERRKRQRFTMQQPLVSTKSELELVKKIVYINNSTDPVSNLKRSTGDSCNQILVVGVCGGSGSGKTTLSRAIMAEFGADRVSYLSHDFYYKDLAHLSMEQRAKHNFDHPNALETDLMIEHLKQIRAGKTVDVPIYDFNTHLRCKATAPMKPNSVVLVEGILIFADQTLANLMDIKIFVETSADIRLVRRLHRDMEERGRTAESVMDQYMKTAAAEQVAVGAAAHAPTRMKMKTRRR
ncbi:RxLR-like protein [Plasmopara halstedii]|uniref:uridine/cytidine kinase n=1 Tax=Plasmopara halstedii TaxID=4781 RepID=A0A0N7L3A8_PLAHL|nr:RxLR-like protein [Plasmopara halstedii]CEG35355.1 RxLR-like protein [Plasmopara halstedii]|eukprot:XP_024571724.1 RxLR-like protein [Plasmopara halstedii]